MEASTYKANGIFAKELEDELMKFTMKSEDTEVQKEYSVNPYEEVQKEHSIKPYEEMQKEHSIKPSEEVQKEHSIKPYEEVQKEHSVKPSEEVQKEHSIKPYEEVQKEPSVEPSEEVQKNIDMEVNITECTKPMDNKVTPPENQDLAETESSSSFDESDSGFDNVADTLGNFEDLSDLCGDSDGFGDNFRRKKLTAHWRSFIQPIMWRCKWTELQIKKLQSLAQQYDRELEEHNKRKEIQLADSTFMDGVKSLPFSRTNVGSGIVRRKKRRMTEATTDVAAYMSSHNLFSYYENKKNPTEGATMSNLPKAAQKVNTDNEFWANDDLSSFVAGDGDNYLEDILRKIEFLQSQAGQLRSRVDRVISENAEKFFTADNLNLPILPSDNLPANIGGRVHLGTYMASHHISEYNMADDDEIVLDSAVTNHKDGGGSSLDANVDRARLADAYKNVEDGALIKNRRVKEEMNNVEEVIIDPIKKSLVNVNEPGLPSADQPPPKIRSISKTTAPRSKRKRGRKKGVRRRTRRSTG